MYKISKRIEISAAHSLKTTYESLCNNLHGHNWMITIHCKSETLNENGMVEDFSAIKSLLTRKLDHKNLNEVLPFNPTAENIAKWICDQIPTCYKVEVQESENNIASYEK
ncbi:MAG: 6-carboxytetrahydropterin synthase QueD [Paludibacteraceae bacterium]|nr:6-carboxytetrahydropterin synthase QueD [Paludibacteraceae bacterium]HOI27245.1 6-carboxytetrahydropterin synthase QueD [Paludibacteraceae bacterium]HOU67748.1 6-carboxytetrahydropterin synthase QueD [Paludibacteraceae bacterium]HPH62854.1 6-carboxytetrahydropterin synthase QueD [Paludibacteraceae bacterium]HQF49763.1 6-carboxytetrahydropterin synthase QueD [Paludibacteraceae bacterium]